MKIALIYIHYLKASKHVTLYFLTHTSNKVLESVFKTKTLQYSRAIFLEIRSYTVLNASAFSFLMSLTSFGNFIYYVPHISQ